MAAPSVTGSNPGPNSAPFPPVETNQQYLPGTWVFAGLPTVNLPIPTLALTTDQGLCTWNGTAWVQPGTSLTTPQKALVKTPFDFGAVGDGITDDRVALQACANNGYCLIPPGYTFLTTVPIQIPQYGTFEGVGPTSIIQGSNVVGGVIQIGIGSGSLFNANVRFLTIQGTASSAIKVNFAYNVNIDSINLGAGAFVDGFHFDQTFGNSLCRLNTNGTTIGGSVTFTASVGGATTGTLTGAKTNGVYNFHFANGETRKVTVTSGTTATWSNALLAGTTTTAYYGACFWVGGSFSANLCHSWYTSNVCAFGLYCADDNAQGQSYSNVFNNLTCQNSRLGLYCCNLYASVFNGLYMEATISGVQVGDNRNVLLTGNLTFNSPILSAAGGEGYAALFYMASGFNVTVNAPAADDFSYYQNFAPVTLTLGGGDTTGTQGVGLALVNPAGVVRGLTLMRPGYGYTAAPTVSFGGSGSGATGTATYGVVAAFTGNINGTTLTVTAWTSGLIKPGDTCTGGTQTAGTYIQCQLTSTDATGQFGKNGTYQVNFSQVTKTCTGTSAITGLTLTAGGSGYGAGHAHWLISNSAGPLTITSPFSRATQFQHPTWSMIAIDANAFIGGAGSVTIVGDVDQTYTNDGGWIGVAVSANKGSCLSNQGIMNVCYDFGQGALQYIRAVMPVYP